MNRLLATAITSRPVALLVLSAAALCGIPASAAPAYWQADLSRFTPLVIGDAGPADSGVPRPAIQRRANILMQAVNDAWRRASWQAPDGLATSVDELAPNCFLWPASTSDAGSPALCTVTPPPESPDNFWITLGLTDEGLQLHYPAEFDASGTDEQVLAVPGPYTDPMRHTHPNAPRHPVGPAFFSAGRGTEYVDATMFRQWAEVHTTGEAFATSSDVRLLGAVNDLSTLIQRAVLNASTLPTSIEEAEHATGATLINMVPVPPDQATITLGWDGVQAYRITCHFPSGYDLDTVDYFTLVGGNEKVSDTIFERSKSFAVPFYQYQQAVGRSFETIGSWRLAEGAEIGLPGLPSTVPFGILPPG
ncbi:MAG: hypothetical protein ABI743_00935 [bacterium]